MTILAQRFLFDLGPLAAQVFRPRFNIAPTQDVAAVRLVDGKRQLAMFHWGLIPSWSKDAKLAYSTINARADSVATKPAFRSAFRKRRCLVLANGYYEWRKHGKAKLPYLCEVDGGEPFAFAGLWELWQGLESCTIVTTEANEMAAQIHDRMPVILDSADFDAWLDPAVDSQLHPFPAERMSVRPVSTFVNNVRHEGPECIEPPNSL